MGGGRGNAIWTCGFPSAAESPRAPPPSAGGFFQATSPLDHSQEVPKPSPPPGKTTSPRVPHPGRASTANAPASNIRTSDPPRLVVAPAQTPTKRKGVTSWTHPEPTNDIATGATSRRPAKSPPSFPPPSLHPKPAPSPCPLARRITYPESHWFSSSSRPDR